MMGDVSESFCVAVQTSDRQYVPLKVVAGRIPDTSSRRSPAILRKSHSTCSPCQNSSDCPKKAPNLIDMAGVIERLPWTISLMARGETPIARAIAFWEIPIGFRYSSRSISPGVIGLSMPIAYNVMGIVSMVVDDGDLGGAGVGPSENDAPLVVDSDGMKA